MDFSNMTQNLKNVLTQGLPIMVAGLLGVLLVTVVIIIAVSLMAKLGGGDGYFSKGIKALFAKKK